MYYVQIADVQRRKQDFVGRGQDVLRAAHVEGDISQRFALSVLLEVCPRRSYDFAFCSYNISGIRPQNL